MSAPMQPIESQPLGDAPELLPATDIEGMEPYNTFLKRMPQTILHIPKGPTMIVVLDDCNTPFTSWKMAQTIVSVLHNLPTSLVSEKEREWAVKHFQLRKETIPDPDYIVLPTDGSVLCYRYKPGDEFVPKANYIAHNDARHDLLKEMSTFVIVDSTNCQRPCSIPGLFRHCPRCRKKVKHLPQSWHKYNPQQKRILSFGRDKDDDIDGGGKDEEQEEDSDPQSSNETYFSRDSSSVSSLSSRSSLDSIAPDNTIETAMPGMSRDQDGRLQMTPPDTMDEDDEPDSPAMLEFESCGSVRRDSDPPSVD
ncbi:hypothetical protein EDD18DRAFT_1104400 [Armillaria luteobubalina]|uniref:Uncharacterized protein n=1 Tax=Armillaria luteobubalina TaxID=153913 RepID=A0AA39UPJ6_9AGAR|nr:hypothetical protein EDD18DRAFT_1104400 [Armillaria luteobubalina]